MAGIIADHFRILIAQKLTKKKQYIVLMDVQREIGVTWSTLNSLAINQLNSYDTPVIMALCEYFDCQVGIHWFLRSKINEDIY